MSTIVSFTFNSLIFMSTFYLYCVRVFKCGISIYQYPTFLNRRFIFLLTLNWRFVDIDSFLSLSSLLFLFWRAPSVTEAIKVSKKLQKCQLGVKRKMTRRIRNVGYQYVCAMHIVHAYVACMLYVHCTMYVISYNIVPTQFDKNVR